MPAVSIGHPSLASLASPSTALAVEGTTFDPRWSIGTVPRVCSWQIGGRRRAYLDISSAQRRDLCGGATCVRIGRMFRHHALLLLVSSWLMACASRGPSPKAQDIFLWSVTAEPGREPVAWLLGSVHIAREGDGIDRAALDAYEKAERLAVELDIEALDVTELNELMTRTGRYEEGRSLSAMLGAKDYQRLSALFAERLPVPELDRFKPWLAAMLLAFTSMSGDGAGAIGVDRYFLTRARGHKAIVSLETFQEQIDALESASDSVQLLELRRTMDTIERGESPLDQLLDSYIQGSASALEEAIGATTGDDERKAWIDRLVRERNVNMADRAAALIRDGARPFIVVGAGHLIGADSVQALLAKHGFHVAPVRATGERVPLELPTAVATKLPKAVNHQVGWPCAEATVSEVDAGGMALPLHQCNAGAVHYALSSADLPAAVMNTMTDEQFFALQIQQLKQQLGVARIEHRSASVAAVSARGVPLEAGFPARWFSMQLETGQMVGLVVKAGTRSYTLIAMVLSKSAVAQAQAVLDSFVLEVAPE